MPRYGDRVVTIDSATSLSPYMYRIQLVSRLRQQLPGGISTSASVRLDRLTAVNPFNDSDSRRDGRNAGQFDGSVPR